MKRSRISYLREKENQRIRKTKRNNAYLGAFVLGFLTGTILTSYIYKKTHKITALEPLQSTIEVKAEEVTYNEDYYKAEPLRYLRYRGQQLGIKDTEISKIIATMRCESGLKADAINKNSNGTFDIGIGQINDVHSERISRQDRMDFVKNIDFIYKLYQEQGLNPWVCSHKLGYVK